MMPDLTQQHSAKLVLLGEMGSGKSSLVLRFVKGQFFDYQVRFLYRHFSSEGVVQESTIGAAFLTKLLPEHNVKFEIWDTAGQERYHSLAPMYYRGAAAAILVYDVSNADSFIRAKKWVKELQTSGNANMVMALAGNKCDLIKNDEGARQVTVEEAQAYAEENGLFLLETSAKDATNVDELFEQIAERLPKVSIPPPAHPPSRDLRFDENRSTSKSSCC